MSPLGPVSARSPSLPRARISPPPPSAAPLPPSSPADLTGRSGDDEAAIVTARSGARPGARLSTVAEADPDHDAIPPAPPPPKQPSSVVPPDAHPAILDSMRPRRAGDLSGSWEIQDVVGSTTYPEYRGLRLTYRIVLHQDGERISGDGEKWAENGRRIPASQRTPIHLSGEMAGREVRVRFTESGKLRDSAGNFRWRLSADGTSFAGTFASGAAGARGVSAAVRLP
jgi:hypothetical protein